MKMRIEVSVPLVSQDEALELMIYHLTIAAAYFEAVSDDHATNIEAVLIRMKEGRDGNFIPAFDASKLFYESLRQQYDALANEETDITRDWLEGKQC